MNTSRQSSLWTQVVAVAMVTLQMTSEVHGRVTPIVYTFGDNFKIGYEMGETMRHVTRDMIGKHKGLNDVLLPFNKTAKGQALYTQLLAASEKHYPQYIEELKGLAEGAGVDFSTLFLLHIEPEVNILQAPEKKDYEPPRPSGGCSAFFVRNKEWALHVHSEDTPPETRYLGAIWIVEIPDQHFRITESFIAYAYPGMLPGSAWYINSHGVMLTGNIMFSTNPPPEGAVPRRILSRALMGSRSIQDFITKLQTAPALGSGFNFMLSERSCEGARPECVNMTGVEMASDSSGTNLIDIHNTNDYDWHFNEYRYLDVGQHLEDSTRWRRHRLAEFSPVQGGDPSTLGHLEAIMSDTQNRKFPFFRDGAPPDYLATASIAMADYYNHKLYIYNDKPSQTQPEVVLNLTPWYGKRFDMEDRILDSKKSWQDHVNERLKDEL